MLSDPRGVLKILCHGIMIIVLLSLLVGCGAAPLGPDPAPGQVVSEPDGNAPATRPRSREEPSAPPAENPSPDDHAKVASTAAADLESAAVAEAEPEPEEAGAAAAGTTPEAPRAAPAPASTDRPAEAPAKKTLQAAPAAQEPPTTGKPEVGQTTVTPAETTAPEAAVPSAALQPTMDLGDLEQRLRKTKAIGLFTKLEIKSEVDELLDEVDDYHRSRSGLELPQLKERFNLLVMKLLVLLEDGDPQLRRDLAQARPALWTALADPHQFTAIKGP